MAGQPFHLRYIDQVPAMHKRSMSKVLNVGGFYHVDDTKLFNQRSFSYQLRPAWTPVNMALMVLFFITGLWLFGLAMIAYMLYGKDIGLDLSNWGKARHSVNKAFDRANWSSPSSSGNSAFDDWRKKELARLEEERQKLEDARKEFEDYMQELRRARDQEEFNNFQTRWNARKDESPQHEAPLSTSTA